MKTRCEGGGAEVMAGMSQVRKLMSAPSVRRVRAEARGGREQGGAHRCKAAHV